MSVKNIVFMSACLFVFSQPIDAFADRCDDVMEVANKRFKAAGVASKQKEYAEAVNLYNKAERYYVKASKMKNCRCPKIERAATYRVSHCRDYAAQNRKALEHLENNYKESYDQPESFDTSCGDKSLVTVQDEKGFVVDTYCE